MDRKSIIILLVCFVFMLCWPMLINKFYPPVPVANVTSPVSNIASQTPPGGTNAPAASFAASAVPLPAASVTPTNSKFIVSSEIPEQLLVVSNDNARYTFTSRGGGLQQVQLLHFTEAVSSRRSRNRSTNDVVTLNETNVPPVFAILGEDSLQGDGVFKLTPIANGVRAEKTLPNGLAIVKDFQLGTNYLVDVSVTFQNHSGKPLVLPEQQWVAGTATPMYSQDNGLTEAVFWYNGVKSAQVSLGYFNTNTSSFFGMFPRTPLTEYLAGSANVNWVSAQNQYFTLATIPQQAAELIVVHMVDLPPPSLEEIIENPATIRHPRGLQAAIIYPGQPIEPGHAVTNQFTLFAGPKEYHTLAHLAARFNNDIDVIMSFGIFGPIAKTLLAAMNGIHYTFSLPYGLIIILITVVIKLLFWPLTRASTRSAKRMQALQPQLKALQAKYKDDPQKFTAKQWEFYKKNKVNPLSGCLPMLLQVPVFLGFYGMLRTAIELRGAPFLWIGDLSKPDTIFSLPIPLHFFGLADGYLPINPAPIIMGVTQLWQASMMPPSPGMDPAQAKMMRFMPLMMLVFMYNLSSGLVVYWTVSNLLTILQTKLTKAQPDAPPNDPSKTPALAAPQKKKK
jgi:YidC/Oxa1 family membrane protein insertase